MTSLLHALGYGMVTSAVVALSAVALSLQWSISNIPNFAHGEFLTFGAYGALIAQQFSGNLLVDALVGAVAGAGIAWVCDVGVIEPFLRAKVRVTTLFVATIGISIILQNALALGFGSQVQTYRLGNQKLHHVGPFLWTTVEIAVMIAAAVIMLALHVLLRYTRLGRAIRAVADDRRLARASGIDTKRVVSVTWLLAGAIAGVGGCVLAASGGSFNPATGFNYLLVTFAAAVVGGIGRPYGAMVGALVVGIVTEVSAAYLSASYKQVFAVGLLIVFLLIRPAGLFSAKAGTARA